MNEYQLNSIEEEAWGDDELTGIDISIPFLLEKADWTSFYNQKGYPGKYPFLLYSNDDAEVLNDRILSEVNRTQILTGHNKLQADIYTRFTDHDDQVVGFVWLAISGTRSFASDLLEDLQWLLKSGVKAYLEHAYTSHGKEASVEWTPIEQHISYKYIQDKLPPKSNVELASYLFSGTITPRE